MKKDKNYKKTLRLGFALVEILLVIFMTGIMLSISISALNSAKIISAINNVKIEAMERKQKVTGNLILELIARAKANYIITEGVTNSRVTLENIRPWLLKNTTPSNLELVQASMQDEQPRGAKKLVLGKFAMGTEQGEPAEWMD